MVALWVVGLAMGLHLERTVGARVPGAGPVVFVVQAVALVVLTLVLLVVRSRRPDRAGASLIVAGSSLFFLFFLLRSVG